MKANTYRYPNHFETINGIELPPYLGMGMLDFDSVIDIHDDRLWANYYEQDSGMLNDNLVYKIVIDKEESTIYRYFEGEKYKESTDKSLTMAFFKSFNFKKGTGESQIITEDKPLFQFAKDIMHLGIYSHLYQVSHLYYPAGLLVQLVKPLIDEEVTAAWIKFTDTYSNSIETETDTILPSIYSPFTSIEYDGTATVYPVFLKDAIAVLKKEDLLGESKETAIKAFYV